MKSKNRKGIHELYAETPEQAADLLWGQKGLPASRRGFLSKSALAAMSAAVGGKIVFGDRFPSVLIPAALAQNNEPFQLEGKDGLIVLNDRPVNAETPAHFLDDKITPANRLFVRNNGLPPTAESINPDEWTLEIGGESIGKPTTFTIAELKEKFESHTYQLTIECGGNGRSEFNPPATGNQWTTGAVGCPKWTGVRLRDVLKACDLKDDAIYTGYYGRDTHLSGDPNKNAISRGVPIAKALEDESIIAYAMNDEDIPYLNGYPLRLVTAGWPASTSGKWLKKIVARNVVHDGAKMTGTSYRVPNYPVAPGTDVPEEDMMIIEAMPVKSLVTFPQSGIEHKVSEDFSCRGHAWAGDLSVKEVHVSIDFGATWKKADLEAPVNRLAWQHWSVGGIKFPKTGYYEVWARAVDETGTSQPMILPGWNPKGYLNNACHRIAIQAV
ncbi:MAG: sulfite oxidase [Verrucomicrobiales bacterium]|nr:sulfite oxidase [Verrucomicrobiales bacterium]